MMHSNTSGRYLLSQTIKWLAYVLVIFVCYLAETSGSYLKPLLLIPAALCIASHTGEIQAMAVGTICGLLLDLACGKLLGYNAVWLVVACVTVSLLHSYLLREKLLNMLLLTVVCTAVQGYLDFVFYYAIWGHEDVSLIYTRVILPSGMMTVAAAVPLYFLISWIARICGSKRKFELEKTVIRDN